MERYIVREPRNRCPQPSQLPQNFVEIHGQDTELYPNIIEHHRIPFNPNVNHSNQQIQYLGLDANQTYLQPTMNIQRPPLDSLYVRTYSSNSHANYNYENIYDMAPTVTAPGVNSLSEYLNRNFVGPERNTVRSFTPQVITTGLTRVNQQPTSNAPSVLPNQNVIKKPVLATTVQVTTPINREKVIQENKASPSTSTAAKTNEQTQNKTATRADKLKALYKSGPRSFAGSVEKVLKWHKTLQGLGVFVLYEIVAKCVNIRPGQGCCKQLLVRDEGGPAIQVLYYEIDFLLSEFRPPCKIRIVGKMMPGSNRMQAYSVRPATGDDVAALPRRAAVAAHHVAKLCKEYGD